MSATNGTILMWNVNTGSYTKDWSVQVDTHLSAPTLLTYNFVNLSLLVTRSKATPGIKPFAVTTQQYDYYGSWNDIYIS